MDDKLPLVNEASLKLKDFKVVGLISSNHMKECFEAQRNADLIKYEALEERFDNFVVNSGVREGELQAEITRLKANAEGTKELIQLSNKLEAENDRLKALLKSSENDAKTVLGEYQELKAQLATAYEDATRPLEEALATTMAQLAEAEKGKLTAEEANHLLYFHETHCINTDCCKTIFAKLQEQVGKP